MKTEKKLNSEIQIITTKIENNFPELSKYLEEIPVKATEDIGPKININALKDYHDSLDALLKKYATDHKITANKYHTISYNTSI